jgi:hypothetical protein
VPFPKQSSALRGDHMAQTAQINFSLKELTVALIRHHGLHEGKWMLGFEFEQGAGNLGPSDAELRPGAIVRIKSAVLVRQDEVKAEIPFLVDAAEVNPPPTASKRRAT